MKKYLAQARVVDNRGRSLALSALCLGVLMIGINASIVNVALPSIRLDLRFSETSLVWVMNAYFATFGGFLLLGGRLGDIFDGRRLYLLGLTLVVLTSLGCALATSPLLLIVARSGQGLGGAIVSAVALSQIMNLFTDPSKRAKALGLYVLVGAGGSSVGPLLGGALTGVLSWRWVFLVNVPIGVAAYALCGSLLPRAGCARVRMKRLDVAGATTATTSLTIALYAIVNANQSGWSSAYTLTLLGSAGVLLVLFVGIEARVQSPLISLSIFRIRNVTAINISGALLSAAVFAWSFVSAMYLQLVLQLSPLQAGLVFLPANVTIALMSLIVSPMLAIRLGVRVPLVVGMLLVSAGLALLARAPVSANVVLEVFPGMLILGLGYGMAYHPLLLSAVSSVAPCNSGAASGIINTSLTVGGALGLSIVVSIAAVRTEHLLVTGATASHALGSGYQIAFCVGAFFAALGAFICGGFIRDVQQDRSNLQCMPRATQEKAALTRTPK